MIKIFDVPGLIFLSFLIREPAFFCQANMIKMVFNEIDGYLSYFLGRHFIISVSCDYPEVCRYSGNNEFGFAFLKFLIKRLAFFTSIAVKVTYH